MRATKLTVARLYNLGSYEHVRYEISVEVAEGESAATALIGLERILGALNPKSSTKSREELKREQENIDYMNEQLGLHGPEEFTYKHGHFEGTPQEYIERCTKSHLENVAKRDKWEARAAKARQLLEDLGGAANWKDAKLEWDDNDFGD